MKGNISFFITIVWPVNLLENLKRAFYDSSRVIGLVWQLLGKGIVISFLIFAMEVGHDRNADQLRNFFLFAEFFCSTRCVGTYRFAKLAIRSHRASKCART